MCLLCFFFFKQKTAYEMRISDWSSDVCSSDLDPDRAAVHPHANQSSRRELRARHVRLRGALGRDRRRHLSTHARARDRDARGAALKRARRQCLAAGALGRDEGTGDIRSEEHTSELQSLMRTSYAGFCLKKKKQN